MFGDYLLLNKLMSCYELLLTILMSCYEILLTFVCNVTCLSVSQCQQTH